MRWLNLKIIATEAGLANDETGIVEFIAYVEEVPGLNTQGQTLKQARENLKEAAYLLINRQSTAVMNDFITYLTQQDCWRFNRNKYHEQYIYATNKMVYVAMITTIKK